MKREGDASPMPRSASQIGRRRECARAIRALSIRCRALIVLGRSISLAVSSIAGSELAHRVTLASGAGRGKSCVNLAQPRAMFELCAEPVKLCTTSRPIESPSSELFRTLVRAGR